MNYEHVCAEARGYMTKSNNAFVDSQDLDRMGQRKCGKQQRCVNG